MSQATETGSDTSSEFELQPVGDPEIYRVGGFKPPDLSDPTTFTTGQDMDMSLQRKLWVFQRVGWTAMGLIVILAVLGLFGGRGWLSTASAGSADNLEVEYPRFERRYRPTTLQITVPAGTAQDGQVTLWLGSEYLDGLDISGITPEPSEQVAGEDGLGLVFNVADPSQPFEVSVSLQYERAGRERGELWLDGHPRVTFAQLIYP